MVVNSHRKVMRALSALFEKTEKEVFPWPQFVLVCGKPHLSRPLGTSFDFGGLIPRDYVFSTFLVPYAPLIGPGWIDKRPMARSDPGDRLAAGCRPAASRPPGAAPPPP